MAPLPLLRVYLLGRLDFEAAQRLQRLLAFRHGDDGAALLLCEHAPLISVGRHGRPADVLPGDDERRARGWPLCWVSRGGGAFLHLPGQLAVYPTLPLARLGLSVPAYLDRLQQALADTLADFGIAGERRPPRPGVWVGPRLLAAVGVGVRSGVTTFGALLNIDPDLTLFRLVRAAAATTSLARERRGPVRPALVRQRLVEHFAGRFGFAHTDLRFDPPELLTPPAAAARARRPSPGAGSAG